MVSDPEKTTYHAASAVPVSAKSGTPPISAAEFSVKDKEGYLSFTHFHRGLKHCRREGSQAARFTYGKQLCALVSPA